MLNKVMDTENKREKSLYLDKVNITISGNGIFSVEPIDVLSTKAANDILENAKNYRELILRK